MVRKLHYLVVLFMLLSVGTMAQSLIGTVSDAKGERMPGVSVALKGTTVGTATDGDGKFALTIPNSLYNNAVLIVSFIGYNTLDVPVAGKSVLNITLEEGALNLNEVVVTALGIAREQKSLGYATTQIKANELIKVANTNVASSLYGKAPGVRIASGPGGATSPVNITVRGGNSLSLQTQPIIILDGVPIRNGAVSNDNYWGDQRQRGNGLNDINPEDIESLSILKGASAAALYGSEAVNGVVLITTKKGTGKGFSVDFNTNFSVDKVAYLPRFQNVRGAGAPLNVSNGGQDANGFIYYDTNGDGTKDTRGLLQYSINFGPKFDGQPIMSWDGVVRPYSAQPDGYKNLFQDAQNSQVNVAVTQSNSMVSSRLSFTRQDNEGVSLNAKNQRNIANLNTTFNFSKNFKTDVMVNYVNQNTMNRPYSTDRMINNFTGMLGRFDNGDWYKNRYETSQGYKAVIGATGQSVTPGENIIYNGYKADILDYMWRVYRYNVDEKSNRVISSITNTYNVTPNFSLRARFSNDFTSQNTDDRRATEKPLAFGYSGEYISTNELYSVLYGEFLATYVKKLTEKMELTVRGGYNATNSTFNLTSRSTDGGLSSENFFDVAASVNKANSDTRRQNRVIDAIVGVVNFDYDNFVYVEGTIRRDRTSTMHPDNNSFVYPSINSSLVFSQKWTMPSFLDYGKLRASWGIVGNYPGIYDAPLSYSQGTLGSQVSGGSSVLYTELPWSFGNDNIAPERKHEYEIGLETRLFKNKIGLDITHYNAQIRNQILRTTLAATTGAGEILANTGTLRNKGIEIGLNTTPIKRKDFIWDLSVNYAWNRNTVEKLTDNSNEILHADYDGNAAQLRSTVGQPMGDLYAHGIATDASGNNIIQSDGLYKLDANWKKIGNTQPVGVGGIFNTLTFKSFTLNASIDYRLGGYVMPTGVNWMTSRGLTEESTKYMDAESGGLSYYMKDGKGIQTTASAGPNGETVYHDGMLLEGVTGEGQKNTNVISQAYYYWNVYNWGGPQYSSARYELYMDKATYVKMRELTLGYSLPANLTKKIGAKRVTVSVFGRNLFFLYRKLKDIDPEVLTAGTRWTQTINNAGTNPASRTVGIMLRSSF